MHIISYKKKSIRFKTLREAVDFMKGLANEKITFTHIFEE